MDIWTPALSLLALATLVALAWCGVLNHRIRKLQRIANERVDVVARDLQALCASTRTVGDRMVELDRLTRKVMERQTQLEMQAPSTEQFKHAIALVQRGAGTEELVSACGLAEGEAELICLLHGTPGGVQQPRANS